MYSFATSRTHGLGMKGWEFWTCTPREFESRTRIFERERDFVSKLYAGIQVTLHNAHFKRQDGKPYTEDMFLGAAEEKEPSKPDTPEWKRDLAHLRRVMGAVTPHDPAVVEVQRTAVLAFDSRASRAKRARANGASREEIHRIMEGVA